VSVTVMMRTDAGVVVRAEPKEGVFIPMGAALVAGEDGKVRPMNRDDFLGAVGFSLGVSPDDGSVQAGDEIILPETSRD